MRVLITGSRDFRNYAVTKQALTEVTADQEGPHTLVHGAARGADSLAAVVARQLEWAIEEHPADWTAPCRDTCKHNGRQYRPDGSEYCPSAGSRRNQLMVDLGADVLVALYKRGAKNRGTGDAVRRAAKAGIPTRRWAS
jgi:YspA, cpYpsA-related SLOG family